MAVKNVFKKGSHVVADMIILEGPGIEPYIRREYERAVVNKLNNEDSFESRIIPSDNLYTDFYLPKYPFKIPYIAECWLSSDAASKIASYKQYRDYILEESELPKEFLLELIPMFNTVNVKTYCLYNYAKDRLSIFDSIITKEEYEETKNWPIFVGSDPSDTLIIESEDEYKNISVELYSPTRVINLLDPIWRFPNAIETAKKILQTPIEHTQLYIKAGDNELYFDDIVTDYAEIYRKYILRLINKSNFSEGKTFSAKKITKKFWKDVENAIDDNAGG